MNQAGSSLQLRRARAATLLGVLLVALAELLAVLWGAFRPSLGPSMASQVRAVIAPMAHSGDAVVATPAAFAAPLLGLVGDAIPRESVVFVDPSRFEHAIELSLGGSSSRELSGWTGNQQSRIGSVLVRYLTNPKPVPLRYDLVARLQPGEALVSSGPAGGAGMPCNHATAAEVDLPAGLPLPWTPCSRFTCGGDPRGFVAQVILDDARGTSRRCIWTFPTTNAVKVIWPKVAAGTFLRAGVVASPSPTGATRARVRFKANGAVIGEREVDASSTFDSFDLQAPMLSGGGEVTLEVEQMTEHLAPVCVEASVR
jgi:hypothetical protein